MFQLPRHLRIAAVTGIPPVAEHTGRRLLRGITPGRRVACSGRRVGCSGRGMIPGTGREVLNVEIGVTFCWSRLPR